MTPEQQAAINAIEAMEAEEASSQAAPAPKNLFDSGDFFKQPAQTPMGAETAGRAISALKGALPDTGVIRTVKEGLGFGGQKPKQAPSAQGGGAKEFLANGWWYQVQKDGSSKAIRKAK